MGSSRFSLPPDLIDDLQWYWRRSEADLGVHSNWESQVFRLKLLSPSENREERPPPSPASLSKAERSLERYAIRNEKLRLESLFGKPAQTKPSLRDPMPDHRSKDRKRLVRVHTTITRMVKREGLERCPYHKSQRHPFAAGSVHETILYRVHGSYEQSSNHYRRFYDSEISSLVEFTRLVTEKSKRDGSSFREAGESLLPGKTPPWATVQTIREQAAELLEHASLAYNEAARAGDREREKSRSLALAAALRGEG